MKTNTEYDHKKGWGRINPDRLSAVEKYSSETVLDIGCASGDYVRWLNANGRQARGCDIEEHTDWKSAPEFFIADADTLSLPSESVDTILCFEVLEHLPRPFESLRSMHAICRKNIIVSVPNCTQYPEMRTTGLNFNHYIDSTHRNFWTPEDFGALVSEAGFHIEETRLINQVRPDILFFSNLLRIEPLARIAAMTFNALPWIKRHYMTTLIVASK